MHFKSKLAVATYNAGGLGNGRGSSSCLDELQNRKGKRESVWKTVEGVHQRLKSENACTRKKVQGGAAGEGY